MGEERKIIIVPVGVVKERADKFIANQCEDFSRSIVQQAFDSGDVECNGKVIPRKAKVSAGDTLSVRFPQLSSSAELIPKEMPLDVLYEDKDILAINKASGVIVHPGSGTGDDTLVHGLLHYTQGNLSPLAGEMRPGVVHRLDKETSGVILFAKTEKAYLRLIEMFSARTIDKQYLALVNGYMEHESGTVKEPIERHEINRVKMAVSPKGKFAHTDWAVEARYGKYATLVRCFLHTGRTHQIRVHMSHIGHPILGDGQYGYKFKSKDKNQPQRVMLHAERIKFAHPITRKLIEIVAPLPKDLEDQIANCKANM